MRLTKAGSIQTDPFNVTSIISPNVIRPRTNIGTCRLLDFESDVYFALQSGHTRYGLRL